MILLTLVDFVFLIQLAGNSLFSWERKEPVGKGVPDILPGYDHDRKLNTKKSAVGQAFDQ